MHTRVKNIIDELVESRIYVHEKCAAEKLDEPEEIEAIWEGYLIVVAAVYSQPTYEMTDHPSGMNPEGQ
jgi:hypothetical protein